MYRGVEYKTQLLRKITLEIAVNDDFLERTIETVSQIARTGPEGTIGDGKIFVLPIQEVHQIGGNAQAKRLFNRQVGDPYQFLAVIFLRQEVVPWQMNRLLLQPLVLS